MKLLLKRRSQCCCFFLSCISFDGGRGGGCNLQQEAEALEVNFAKLLFDSESLWIGFGLALDWLWIGFGLALSCHPSSQNRVFIKLAQCLILQGVGLAILRAAA